MHHSSLLPSIAYYVHDFDPQVFRLSQGAVDVLFIASIVAFCAIWAALLFLMFRQSRVSGFLGLSGVYAAFWGWKHRDNTAPLLFGWGVALVCGAILYHFNPVGWGPRWYGLAYLAGFYCAYLLIKKNSRDGMLRLNPERVPDLVLNACIFGVLMGGRLGFVLFYDLPIALSTGRTPLLWDFSPISPGASIPFWGVLKVWVGGMSAHGGIVFTILTLIWFGRKYRSQGASIVNIGDAACMVVPIGLFFGRIANFINGELYGHPTTVPWAVKFPSEIYAPTNGVPDPGVKDHLFALFTSLDLPISWSNPDPMNQGIELLHARLMQHDPQALAAVAAIIPARHPSQLYEAMLEGLLLFILCWTIGRKWRKDGMASGAFLTFYPIMRIIGEQFRVGDTPAHILGMELSKGVLYSLPLVAAGAIYWSYFIVRSKPRPWLAYSAPATQGTAKSKTKPRQGT